MDPLRTMRTFAAVAELGGFAAAARELDLAPSVVTRHVAALEDRLGARLLTRTTRRVTITPIGQLYLGRVQAILRDVDEAEAAVAQGQHSPTGRVRLIAPPMFARRQLMPLLAALHARHAGVAVELTASGPVDTVSDAHDISIVVRAGALDGDFVAHDLAASQVLLCAAPGYLGRHGQPRHPAELAQHALMLAPLTGVPRAVTMTHVSGARAPVALDRVLLSATNAEMCHAGALAGMGIAALPSFAVQAELEQGRLRRVLPDWRLFDVTVSACLPSRRQVPAVVRAVLDTVRAAFSTGQRDPWLTPSAIDAPAVRLAA